MASVGYATLTIVPSLRGLAAGISSQLGSQMPKAGKAAGEALADGISKCLKPVESSWKAMSRRMAATFTGATNPAGRALANLAAGFKSVDAAASGFTGRMGTLGGRVRKALEPGIRGTQDLASGFLDANAAASAFTGRMGVLGGQARRVLQPVVAHLSDFRAGFLDTQAAASAFTGRMGTLGGVARAALQPGITGVQDLVAGFVDSQAAASAFTGRLGTVGGLLSTAFSGARTGLDRISQGASTAFAGVSKAASAAANALPRSFDPVTSRIAKGITSQIGGALRAIPGIAAGALAAVGLGGIGAAVGAGVSRLSTIEQSQQSLGVMMGDIAVASGFMDELLAFAKTTPFAFPELATAARNMVAFGIDAEKVVPILQSVGDAAAASGGGTQAMSEIADIIGAIQIAGSASTVDLQMLQTRGVDAFRIFANQAGVSVTEMQERISSGAIDSETAIGWLVDGIANGTTGVAGETAKMGGIMDTLKDTWMGSVDSMKSGISSTMATVMEPAMPHIQAAMSWFTDQFKRLPGALSALGDFAEATGLDRLPAFFTGTIVPAVRDLEEAFTPLSEALRTALAGAVTLLMDGLEALGPVITSITGWLKENKHVIGLVATAVLGAVAAYNAMALVRGIISGITNVTKLWSAAQLIFNAVMSANPIMLIVIGLAALVAGLIYAYKNFEGFRKVVDKVFGAIKTGAKWIWENGLKPAFEGIKTGLSAVGDAAMWLWEKALKPAFDFISAAAKILFTALVVAVFMPIMVAVKILGAVFKWLWDKAIKPAFDWIAAGAKWLWDNALKPAWEGIKAGLDVLGSAFKWLYDKIIKPVWNGIKFAIQVAWLGVKVIFAALRKYVLGPLGGVFKWLRDKVIKPVWEGIKTAIRVVWNWVRDKVFDPMKAGIEKVGDAFDKAKEFISEAWDGIKESARTPIKFLVDTVYNDGILPMWNKVAGVVGATELKKATLPQGFKDGGRTSGGIPGKDSIPALLMADEYVIKRSSARRVGFDSLEYINRTGELPPAVQGFAQGGRVGFPNAPRIPSARTLLDAVKAFLSPSGLFSLGGDIITGNYKKAIDKVLSPAKTVTSLIGTKGIPGIPHQVVNKGGTLLKDKISSLVEAWNNSFGGPGADSWVGLGSASQRLQNAAKWARTQHGKPYQWGGNGNPSWDCSGFVSAIESVIRGQRPHRRWSTHAFAGNSAPPGWVRGLRSPYEIGISHSGVGHTAGTLMGVNVESAGGGKGVRVGTSARGARSSMFPYRYGFAPVSRDSTAGRSVPTQMASVHGSTLYDSGGLLQPGLQLIENRTRRPETVRTAAQESNIVRLIEVLERGGRAPVINIQPPPASVGEMADAVAWELRRARRGGVYATAR